MKSRWVFYLGKADRIPSGQTEYHMDIFPFAAMTIMGQGNVSASKLRRNFPPVLSTSIGAFISNQRLRMAYGLIRNGMRVSQAAYRAGYAHPANFATALRHRFGVAPKSLRD